MRRLACPFFALALLCVVGCGNNPKEQIIGKWNTVEEKEPYYLEFARDGKLTWGDDKSKAEGKYTWVDDKTIEIEYELPEAVYQAQKMVFDQAKAAFDSMPDGFLKGTFSQIEPVKKVKDRATVEIKDKEMTLKGGKSVKYKKE